MSRPNPISITYAWMHRAHLKAESWFEAATKLIKVSWSTASALILRKRVKLLLGYLFLAQPAIAEFHGTTPSSTIPSNSFAAPTKEQHLPVNPYTKAPYTKGPQQFAREPASRVQIRQNTKLSVQRRLAPLHLPSTCIERKSLKQNHHSEHIRIQQCPTSQIPFRHSIKQMTTTQTSTKLHGLAAQISCRNPWSTIGQWTSLTDHIISSTPQAFRPNGQWNLSVYWPEQGI